MRHLGSKSVRYDFSITVLSIKFNQKPTFFNDGDLYQMRLASRSKNLDLTSNLAICQTNKQSKSYAPSSEIQFNFSSSVYLSKNGEFDQKIFKVQILSTKTKKCIYETKFDLAQYIKQAIDECIDQSVDLTLSCSHGQSAAITLSISINQSGRQSPSRSRASVNQSVSRSVNRSRLSPTQHDDDELKDTSLFRPSSHLSINHSVNESNNLSVNHSTSQSTNQSVNRRFYPRRRPVDNEVSLIESLMDPGTPPSQSKNQSNNRSSNQSVKSILPSYHTPLQLPVTQLAESTKKSKKQSNEQANNQAVNELIEHEARYRAKMEPLLKEIWSAIFPEYLYAHPSLVCLIDQSMDLPFSPSIYQSSHSTYYQSVSASDQQEYDDLIQIIQSINQSIYWHGLPLYPIIVARLLTITHARTINQSNNQSVNRSWIYQSVLQTYIDRISINQSSNQSNYGNLCYWINCLSMTLIGEGDSLVDRFIELNVHNWGIDTAINQSNDQSNNQTTNQQRFGTLHHTAIKQSNNRSPKQTNNQSFLASITQLLVDCLQSLFDQISYDLSVRIPINQSINQSNNPASLETMFEFLNDLDRLFDCLTVRSELTCSVLTFCIQTINQRVCNCLIDHLRSFNQSNNQSNNQLLAYGMRCMMIHTAFQSTIDQLKVLQSNNPSVNQSNKQKLIAASEPFRILALLILYDPSNNQSARSYAAQLLSDARAVMSWSQLLFIVQTINRSNNQPIYSQKWIDKMKKEAANESEDDESNNHSNNHSTNQSNNQLIHHFKFPSPFSVDVSWRIRPFRAATVTITESVKQSIKQSISPAAQKLFVSLNDEQQLVIAS